MGNLRYAFGSNWKKFSARLTEEQVREAERSLQEWIGAAGLAGKSFLDIGSGSGVFSLAARNLGAEVFSFDYDRNSVACARHLKERFYKGDRHWKIERGDVLDRDYLSKFKKYDIVYSWGVLHHTGSMYQALENAGSLVADGGTLFIAVYNDQGWASGVWGGVKRTYNRSPKALRGFMLASFFIMLWGSRSVKDFLKGTPFGTWKNYVRKRGMLPWTDAADWIGGYPFETAKPEEIFDFFFERGFALERLQTKGGGSGCNQYVFRKGPAAETGRE